MKPTPQLPGCLPKGFDLDSMLTVEQFALWRQESPRAIRARLMVTPGVAGHHKATRIHPRTYLEKTTKSK